ncbi:MAG: hypothetical protein RL033_2091 [Pseudomonadota bacterium]
MSAAPPTEPDSEELDAAPRAPRLRSAYKRALLVVGALLIGWRLLPVVPRDQSVIFALGDHPERVEQLEVQWRAEGQDHEGRLVLNFPSPPPERVVRQFRLAHGEYEFRVIARLRSEKGERTEAFRRVTLEGNTVTLRLEELTQ